MCSKTCCAIACSVVVALVAVLAYPLVTHWKPLFKVGTQLVFTDAERPCELVAADQLHGSEDFAVYGDGVLLVSSGDIEGVLQDRLTGSRTKDPGGIYALDVTRRTARRLELKGFDQAKAGFQPHGIFLSNATARLYAVSHHERSGGSVVQVFEVVKEPSLHLRHLHQVTSPLFGFFTINNLVEGSSDGSDFYVTEFLPLGLPEGPGGLLYFPAWMASLLATPWWRPCRVLRCTLPPLPSSSSAQHSHSLPECSVAAKNLGMANGITVTEDRRTIFVADWATREVRVYARDALDGSLELLHSFLSKHSLDNIIYDSHSKSLWGGTVPQFGDPVPGSFLEIALVEERTDATKGGGRSSFQDGAQDDVVFHDGKVLSSVSVAVRVNSEVVLGSPSSRGVAICKA